MPYPKSPFEDEFNAEILLQVGIAVADEDKTTVTNPLTFDRNLQIQKLEETLHWLCKTPQITTFRVNTLKTNINDIQQRLQNHLGLIDVERCGICQDALIIRHPLPDVEKLQKFSKEVIVDPICGAAILRGAHIFAPGVMAMLTGTRQGDTISVFVDLEKKCKKGLQKIYPGKKVFIGNGIANMVRKQLFNDGNEQIQGIAIEMLETISGCPPQLGVDTLPPGLALLQNLPSILCVHILGPEPNEVILDMCASPGNKTTHIAARMQNLGKLIAIDKSPNKVERLKKRCEEFEAIVEIIQSDSTKLVANKIFAESSFDRILLDAPCSALGKRPQFINTTTAKVLRSYIPLQRKLVENAFRLLKKGGILVYSTCTISIAENEGIVAWALRNFDWDLIPAAPFAGGPGLPGTNLPEIQLGLVQRFGPKQSIDSVGFFVAKFIKK